MSVCKYASYVKVSYNGVIRPNFSIETYGFWMFLGILHFKKPPYLTHPAVPDSPLPTLRNVSATGPWLHHD